MENKTPIELLIEAIDYSFLKTDGTYDKSLTYPVIDKVKFVKRLLEESRNKEREKKIADANYENEFPLTFNDLKDNGIGVGDIVASKDSSTSKVTNYYLLRNGFPENFNTSLCCNEVGNKLHLYQIGFHWIGDISRFRFRKISDEEKQSFINACIETLKTPMKRADDGHIIFGWSEDQYANILANMIRYGLVSEYMGKKLNSELKKIHGIDLLREYKKNYGCNHPSRLNV